VARPALLAKAPGPAGAADGSPSFSLAALTQADIYNIELGRAAGPAVAGAAAGRRVQRFLLSLIRQAVILLLMSRQIAS
jgi:hypothetical protein